MKLLPSIARIVRDAGIGTVRRVRYPDSPLLQLARALGAIVAAERMRRVPPLDDRGRAAIGQLARALAYVLVGKRWIEAEFVRDYNRRNDLVMRKVRVRGRAVLLPTTMRDLLAIATIVVESGAADAR